MQDKRTRCYKLIKDENNEANESTNNDNEISDAINDDKTNDSTIETINDKPFNQLFRGKRELFKFYNITTCPSNCIIKIKTLNECGKRTRAYILTLNDNTNEENNESAVKSVDDKTTSETINKKPLSQLFRGKRELFKFYNITTCPSNCIIKMKTLNECSKHTRAYWLIKEFKEYLESRFPIISLSIRFILEIAQPSPHRYRNHFHIAINSGSFIKCTSICSSSFCRAFIFVVAIDSVSFNQLLSIHSPNSFSINSLNPFQSIYSIHFDPFTQFISIHLLNSFSIHSLSYFQSIHSTHFITLQRLFITVIPINKLIHSLINYLH